jgi:hypothetical protein
MVRSFTSRLFTATLIGPIGKAGVIRAEYVPGNSRANSNEPSGLIGTSGKSTKDPPDRANWYGVPF